MNRHNPEQAKAPEVFRPETRAGRYVIARFPVPPAQADLIAKLAGIGGER